MSPPDVPLPSQSVVESEVLRAVNAVDSIAIRGRDSRHDPLDELGAEAEKGEARRIAGRGWRRARLSRGSNSANLSKVPERGQELPAGRLRRRIRPSRT